mmetsp:Transcript_18645/g.47194  ORF Transcript_18645/g.47194 Transcript_18645/m.47194 type:complete len:113 (-) Transcript_18645:47-385(-)
MFRTRVLLAAAKKSTGLVGVPVVPNARERLVEMYGKTLEKVKEIPADVPYRQSVESITKFRLGVVEKFHEEADIEREIDCGQLEELLEQANDEFNLIDIIKDTDLGKSPTKA